MVEPKAYTVLVQWPDGKVEAVWKWCKTIEQAIYKSTDKGGMALAVFAGFHKDLQEFIKK